MELPKKLVALRKKKGLTQIELAERLNVSWQAISRWEVGSAVPSSDNLMYLGKLYDVPVDYLLNDDLDHPPEKGAEEAVAWKEPEIIMEAPNGKKNRVTLQHILILSLSILLVLVTIAWIKKDQRPEGPAVVSMDEMAMDESDDYDAITFPLE